jgi:uncharacterized glyoxalase superfamily protein PhnB
MNPNLLFDFSVNKDSNTINVKRQFAADLPLVWDAWTKPELLDQWWAPKPFRNKTKSMDFREGGAWHYAMISPENITHWCRTGGGIQRFGDIPADSSHPPVADVIKKMVLHVELPITGNHILMGTDAPKEMGFTLVQGNNMHISVEPETREEAKRIFDQLSAGGTISMPLQDMFFGAYFGEFTDKYGINWMINFQTKTDK